MSSNCCVLCVCAVQLFATTALAVASPGNYQSGSLLEIGGSNYFIYAAAANGGLVGSDVRSVVGTYHLFPAAVQAQLQSLYDSGQRKITLALFHGPFNSGQSGTQTPEPDTANYFVNSLGGQLALQHQRNLREILRWIAYIGFNEIAVRFAPQGTAFPCSQNPPWTSGWSETQYQENLNFIVNTRNLVEATLSPTSVKRTYDLGAELGGAIDGPNQCGTNAAYTSYARTYMSRLWIDYYSRYGVSDTYGFSFAYAPDRVATQIALFDQLGVRPYAYAIDVYDNVHTALQEVYWDLAAAGETSKPVIIQETYTDDATVASQIVNVLNVVPLKIQYVVQWPVSRGATSTNQVPGLRYNSYGGTTLPRAAVFAWPCVLTNLSFCGAQIGWASTNVALPTNLTFNGTTISSARNGFMSYPLSTSTPIAFGSLDTVTIAPRPAGSPTLNWLGAELTGGNLNSGRVAGSNIQSGCTVSMFSADWSTSLGVVSGAQVNCVTTEVTFTIPSSVQQAHDAINVNVNNPNGTWSEPIYFPIDPPAPVLYKSGLGGVGNTSIWSTGINVSQGCSVSIFTPNWSSLLTTLSGSSVSCQATGVAFGIPAWIKQQYPAINFNVNNSYGKWSNPLYQVTN